MAFPQSMFFIDKAIFESFVLKPYKRQSICHGPSSVALASLLRLGFNQRSTVSQDGHSVASHDIAKPLRPQCGLRIHLPGRLCQSSTFHLWQFQLIQVTTTREKKESPTISAERRKDSSESILPWSAVAVAVGWGWEEELLPKQTRNCSCLGGGRWATDVSSSADPSTPGDPRATLQPAPLDRAPPADNPPFCSTIWIHLLLARSYLNATCIPCFALGRYQLSQQCWVWILCSREATVVWTRRTFICTFKSDIVVLMHCCALSIFCAVLKINSHEKLPQLKDTIST